MKEYNAEIARLGAELKDIREKNNLTLETISEQLKIQVIYVDAIEQGNLEVLPTGFYRKSFIKEYCRLFEAEEIYRLYERALAGLEELEYAKKTAAAATKDAQNIPGSALVHDKEYKQFNAKPLLTGAVIVLLLSVGAILLFRSDISSKAKGDSVMQLAGGTEVLIKEKEAEDKKKAELAEEQARKLSEERAKAEEAQAAAEAAKAAAEEAQAAAETAKGAVPKSAENPEQIAKDDTELKLAKSELYISAPEQDITITVSQNNATIYEGKIEMGKAMHFNVEGEFPVRVRYENPNMTDVAFGGVNFKPLHPSEQARSRYYWSDGKVTFTPDRNKQ